MRMKWDPQELESFGFILDGVCDDLWRMDGVDGLGEGVAHHGHWMGKRELGTGVVTIWPGSTLRSIRSVEIYNEGFLISMLKPVPSDTS